MKRFYSEVDVAQVDDGWQVTLDGRAVRTQLGSQQVVPSRAAAELLAGEWRAQGEEIDPRSFVYRDLADFAIDLVRPDRETTITKLLAYAATDTLCYRAEPDEPLWHRQQEIWEPILTACEARLGVMLERTSGIMHRPQSPECVLALRSRLESEDEFTLAALVTLASLAASLVVALAVLEEKEDAATLFAAANCEEDWQAEQWGWDEAAETDRAGRLQAFEKAAEFARMLKAA